MNKRNRFAIVLVVAVTAASASSYVVYYAAQQVQAAPVAPRLGYLVVAARSAPIGAQLSREDVRLVEWPLDLPVAGSFSTVEAVVGRGLLTAVVENEPLTAANLAAREAGAGLPSAIPPGQRAIAVRVNEVIGVAGFAGPGARVDVIATLRDSGDSTARVLVSNIVVLTVGTRSDQEAGPDKPGASTVVTVAVTPEQAQRIALAQVEGQLTLTLRNPLDAADANIAEVRLSTLRGGTREQPAPRAVARAAARTPAPAVAAAPSIPAPPPYVVETIVAGQRSEKALK